MIAAMHTTQPNGIGRMARATASHEGNILCLRCNGGDAQGKRGSRHEAQEAPQMTDTYIPPQTEGSPRLHGERV